MKRRGVHNEHGFTLTETLAVLAIFVIIAALIVPNLINWQREMRQNELDSKAEVIYSAVQNKMMSLRSEGNAYVYENTKTGGVDLIGTPSDCTVELDEDNQPITTDFYAINSANRGSSSVLDQVMVAGICDAELLGNNWVVEYDPSSGGVYAVYYSESDDFSNYLTMWSNSEAGTKKDDRYYDNLRFRDVREQKAIVGYYGGDSATSSDNTSLLQPTISVSNGETLEVLFSCSKPNTVSEDLVFSVALSDSYGHKRTRQYTVSPRPDANEGQLRSTGLRYWVSVVLDDLYSEDTRFDKLYGSQSNASDSERLVAGDVLNISLTVTSANHLVEPRTATASTNGLFADASYNSTTGDHVDTAVLEYGRHVQNLDGLADLNPGIDKARLARNISFEDTILTDDWYEMYCGDGNRYFNGRTDDGIAKFKPIHAPTLLDIESADGAPAGGYVISGLTVDEQGDAGLFASLGGTDEYESTVKVKGISLTGAHVTGTGNTGVLVGAVSGANNEIEDCHVFLDEVKDGLDEKTHEDIWLSGQDVGGLVGSLEEGGSLSITGSLAATVQNGSRYSGGLVGRADGALGVSTSYADSYVYGGTVAGLVGAVGERGVVDLTDCYASGFVFGSTLAAGLSSGSLHDVANVYTICSANGGLLNYSTAPSIAHVNPAAKEEGSSAEDTPSAFYLHGGSSDNAAAAWSASLSGMSVDQLQLRLGTSFTVDTQGASHPYNLMGQGLTTYPYLRLNANAHYGDWESEFKPGSLVYFEKYAGGTYGFYGGEIDQTQPSLAVVGDGYGIVYRESDTPPSTVRVVAGSVFGSCEIHPDSGVAGVDYYPVYASEGLTYRVYPLPKEMTNAAMPRTAEGTLIDSSFYQLVQVYESQGLVSEDVIPSSFYFNPYFAKTVVEGGESATQESAPSAPSRVIVSSPRQLYNLSLSYDAYAEATSGRTFNQDRELNYFNYEWGAFAGLSQVTYQEPIGGGSKHFSANFNGNRYRISNISFMTQSQSYVGMFGYNEGELTNIVLWNDFDENKANTFVARSDEIGPGSNVYMGVLAGYNGASGGSIVNCAVAGYYLSENKQVHATVQAYTNANLSLGGAVGGNAGTIRNCSVDTPELSMTSLDAWVYVGGFVGMNEGTGVISDCYDLGHVVIKTSRGGSVSIAGFAGGNSGTVRSSYCATSMSVSGDAGVPYSFSPAGGTTLSCNFLTNGTYSYANHLRSYSTSVNSSGGAATTRTKLQAMQGKSKPSVSRSYNYTASEESLSGGYPYRAVVKGRGGAWVHYGDWQGEADLGTLGVFYWEHEEGGSNSGYHLTFMSAKITGKEPIEGTTLCNAHDDGGIVTDYGYGYFTKSGLDVESTTVNLGIDGADPDGTVQQRLQDQMDGYAFYPYKTGSDGLHLSTDNASVREGTWTITYSGKSHVFKVAPFFANAMSSEEGRVMVGEDGVSTDYTIEAGTEKNKYEIRSIQQLQYLNWNSVTQSTDKLVTTGNYQQFPYLQYATNLEKGTQDSKAVAANRPVQHYRQSHDLGVLEDEEFPFTPIAGSATSTTGTSYEGKLYAWFGGVFEGESYKIQNFDITSDSYTVGLFGVTVGANIRDIILYSDKGSTIQRVTPSSGGQVNESAGAYSLGGLIGVAYDYITIVNNEIVTSGNTISNCAIAGYNIVDKSENKSTAGGTNIGGLIGVANVQLEKCSAVVDILVDCLHSKGTDGNGTSVRVGGLTGAAQYSVTDCYTGGKIEVSQNTLDEKYLEGGSKTIQFANKTLVALNRNKNVHVYVAGIAGSSFTMNYVNFTNRNNTFSGSPTFKNCYTYMNLPSKVTGTLKGVSIIGGPADRYSSNTARFTVRNCYYLDSIIKNITCEAPEDYVFTASTVKVTDAEGNVSEKKANDLPANASEYFLCTEPYEDVPAGLSKVELYTVEDEGVLSRMLAGNLNDNKKIINSDGQSYTLDSDDSPISTTYAELSEDPNTGTVKLGSTWGKVTTEEGDHVAIPGKYSFPAGDERLAGADYPFPTIVTQPDLVYGGNVNVHYGTWPPESLVWEQGQANIDIFRDMDSGVAKKTFYLDDPNGVIADKIAESGRELAGYFSCSDPDVAEIHEVVVDSEYQGSGARYKVTVWAIGDGFSEVYETASGKNMKFELRVTHDLVAEAVPADTSLVGYLNDTSSLKLSAHSKPNENGGSTSSDIKDYSTSGNWGYDTSDLVVVTRGEDGQNYVSYSVEHKGAGSFVLGFTFTYTYQVPGHAEHTYSERVNVPVKTYGYIGLSGDSELLKNTTYKYDEVLRTKSGTTPESSKKTSGDASLPEDNDGDVFLYESIGDLDLDGKALDGVTVGSVYISDAETSEFEYNDTAGADGNHGYTITWNDDLDSDSQYQYKTATIRYSGEDEGVRHATMRVEFTHSEDKVGDGYTPYSLSLDVDVPRHLVKYDGNEGEGSPAWKKTFNKSEDITLPTDYTRAGYTFSKWKRLSDDAEYDAGATCTVTHDETFQAQWAANTYKLNLYRNQSESDTEVRVETCTYDQPFTLPDKPFTYEGHYFVGWATSSDGDVAYENGATVKNLVDSGEYNLYAVWGTLYSVTLDANQGSPSSQTFWVQNETTITTEFEGYTVPDRSGFTFLGWYTDSIKGEKVIGTNATVSVEPGVEGYTNEAGQFKLDHNVTLYAHWLAQGTVYLREQGESKGYDISTLENTLKSEIAADRENKTGENNNVRTTYKRKLALKGKEASDSNWKDKTYLHYMLDGWYTAVVDGKRTKVINANGSIEDYTALTDGAILYAGWVQSPEHNFNPNGDKWWNRTSQPYADLIQLAHTWKDGAYQYSQYLKVQLDLSTCSASKEELLFSFGSSNINEASHEGVMHVYYSKLTKVVRFHLSGADKNSPSHNWATDISLSGVEPGVVTFNIYRDKLTFNGGDGETKTIAEAASDTAYGRVWMRQERWWENLQNTNYTTTGRGVNTEVSNIGSVRDNKSNASNYNITVESVDPEVDNHTYDDEWDF